jgi:hypothetical protein
VYLCGICGDTFLIVSVYCAPGFYFSEFIISIILGEYMSGDAGKDVRGRNHCTEECERDGISCEAESNDRQSHCYQKPQGDEDQDVPLFFVVDHKTTYTTACCSCSEE